MSLPNIPDIQPKIDITLEDAINLLLASIALEEISLSNLIDAETSKINHVLFDCEHNKSVLQNAIAINNSVDDTIKNIIKLQMLLQFKLEKVQELIPITTTTTTTTTSTTTTTTSTRTTTTKTTTSTTSTRSTTTHKHCRCSLSGKCKGVVDNCTDEFNGSIAVLKAFISINIIDRSISYTVQNDTAKLHLFASNSNINIDCCCDDSATAIVYGKGYLAKESECEPEVKIPVKFHLKVWDKKLDQLEFQITIISDINKELIHNSGVVKICKNISDCTLAVCC